MKKQVPGNGPTVPSAARKTIRENLLHWFAKFGRELPWRRNYSPYEVWISEIMLQQTQIKTMLPYYFRWMERFPDAASVAEASEDEVFRCWEGLGYYARARNLQKTARLLVSEFGGKLPRDFESVRALPGVGPYTAGAIMSFAFNADLPAADANAARIFARLFDISAPANSKEFRDTVWYYASAVLPRGRARDFNQALMDFGSQICLPRDPSCTECPIESCCEARAKGVAVLRPVHGGKKTVTPVVRAIGIAIRDGKVLVRKRPDTGLMPNLWEFPGGEAEDGERPEQTLERVWSRELGMKIDRLEKLAVIKHTHTTFKVTLYAFFCMIANRTLPDAAPSARWIALRELGNFAFPAAHRKVIRALTGTIVPEL